MNTKERAILLMHCPDKIGLVGEITGFLQSNNGNIISLDQHVDPESNEFFMRIEWDLNGFIIENQKIGEFFNTLIAQKYDIKWRIAFADAVPKMAVFVSKYSHCLFDILSRYESGEWKVEIPLIISNHDKFKHVGKRYNIPYYHIPITKDNKAEQEKKQLDLLRKYDIDFSVLARYMQILSDDFISHYPNKIINIHHSSLPAFAGAKPYESAYKRGVKIMGATAHYVTAELDAGPIIYQDVTPITHKDSIKDLKRKGKDIEKIVLSKAIWSHLNNKIISFRNKTLVFGS